MKNELGELVAARNLHIIDVYDDDKNKRQPPFGRVFYVEGKSLIFYAYDLQAPRHLNAKVAFYVWGETAAAKGRVRNLGILHNDEASRGPWTLTFDDPKVLARIDSVFVTGERSTRLVNGPTGKRIFTAFLGGPANHP